MANGLFLCPAAQKCSKTGYRVPRQPSPYRARVVVGLAATKGDIISRPRDTGVVAAVALMEDQQGLGCVCVTVCVCVCVCTHVCVHVHVREFDSHLGLAVVTLSESLLSPLLQHT